MVENGNHILPTTLRTEKQHLSPSERGFPMTDERMALVELLQKSGDRRFLALRECQIAA
jgi:hypothetical protein